MIRPVYAATVSATRAKTAIPALRIASAKPAANHRPAIAVATISVKVLKTASTVRSIAVRRLSALTAPAILTKIGAVARQIADRLRQRRPIAQMVSMKIVIPSQTAMIQIVAVIQPVTAWKKVPHVRLTANAALISVVVEPANEGVSK